MSVCSYEETVEAADSPRASLPSALWATLRLTSTSNATTAKRELRAFRYGTCSFGFFDFYCVTLTFTCWQRHSLVSWTRGPCGGCQNTSMNLAEGDVGQEWRRFSLPNSYFLGFYDAARLFPKQTFDFMQGAFLRRREPQVTIKQNTILLRGIWSNFTT